MTEVKYVTAREASALANVAREAGHATARLDFARISTKRDALAVVAASLDFPVWFGANWDALADCLADMSWSPADGHLVIVEHLEPWRAANEADVETLLEVMCEARARRTGVGAPFDFVVVAD